MLQSVEYKETIINCLKCRNCVESHTPRTGHGKSYFCALSQKWIAQYCENISEFPQDNQIPHWCPLS